MLRIPCPHCGLRDETEFRFGGPAHVARPAFEVSDAEWADYLFNRDNPKGVHYERWYHAYGCGRWFNAARHTVNHAFLAVYPMGAPRPALAQADAGPGAAAAAAAHDAAGRVAPGAPRA